MHIIGRGRYKSETYPTFKPPLPPVVPDYAAQAVWFVNPVTGNDANDGLTPATAIRTLAELRRRLDGATIEQDTTVTLSEGTFDDLELDLTVENGFVFAIQGTVSVVYNGTISARTATDPATATRGSITDAGAVFTDGARLRLTSGAASGFVAYVTRVIAPTQANVTRWSNLSNTVTGTTPTISECGIGDTYSIETLDSTVGQVNIRARDTGRVLMQDFEINSPNLGSCRAVNDWAAFVGGALFYRCRITDAASLWMSSSALFISCVFDVISSWIQSFCVLRACDFRGDVTTQAGTKLQLDRSCCFDGSRLSAGGGYIDMSSVGNDIQWVDGIASEGIFVGPGSTVFASAANTIWGADNAYLSAAVRVLASGSYIYTANKPNIPGGASDCLVGGTARTYAQIPYLEPTNGASIVLQ